MEGKMVYTILLVVIVILALSLAVSVFVLFVTLKGLNTDVKSGDQVTQVDNGPKTVPVEQIVKFEIFDDESDPYFSLAKEEGKEDSILLARITLKCDEGKNNKNSERVATLFDKYHSDIQETVRMYFNDLQPSVAATNDMQKQVKQELKDKINEIFDQGEKEKQYIVVDVILSKWFVQ